MKITNNLIILLLLSLSINSLCYSQNDKATCYKVNGAYGEEYIFINGKELFNYIFEKKWKTWNDVVINYEDSVMIISSEGFLGLMKNQEFIGSLCFESSQGNYITFKESIKKLCQVNRKEIMENKGVVRVNEEITKGSIEYYDSLKYYSINSIPNPDSSSWFVEDRTLKVKSFNKGSVIYDILFETDSSFVVAGIPVRVNYNEELPFSIFPGYFKAIIHVFWQPFDEFSKVPHELDFNNPVFHYSINLE